MFSNLTTEVDILDLRVRQLTFQRSQVIHLLYDIADGSLTLFDLRLRSTQLCFQLGSFRAEEGLVGGQLVTLM